MSCCHSERPGSGSVLPGQALDVAGVQRSLPERLSQQRRDALPLFIGSDLEIDISFKIDKCYDFLLALEHVYFQIVIIGSSL